MTAELPVPPGKLRSVVTYLEMTARPDLAPPRLPRGGATLQRMERFPVADYRALFAAVGERWLWMARLKLDDAQLAAVIHDPAVEVHVLSVDGERGGYYEIDRRLPGEIELVYCGVVPGLIGKGWGTCLIRSAIARAWSFRPRRFWLHTCDFDHPGAVAFYQRQGFSEVRREVEVLDDPRLTGLLPRSAGPHVPLARDPLSALPLPGGDGGGAPSPRVGGERVGVRGSWKGTRP